MNKTFIFFFYFQLLREGDKLEEILENAKEKTPLKQV